jgi:hypothetical protein
MKRIISLILGVLSLGVVAIAQPVPPDVYLKWVGQGIPLTATLTQDIVLPLPQSGISRYSFHYIYLYFNGHCNLSDFSSLTTASLRGYVPQPNGGGDSVIQLGGLVNQNPFSGGNGGPLYIMKGNGAVNALKSTLYLVSNNTDVSTCTLDVLYKGTIHEEEGNTTVGVYAPTNIEIDNHAVAPTVTTSGAMTTYAYPYPVFNANIAVNQITFCTLPIATTGAFRATTPVMVTGHITTASGTVVPLGYYSITNGCYTISNPGLGIFGTGGEAVISYTFPTAATYAQQGELVATMSGRVVY